MAVTPSYFFKKLIKLLPLAVFLASSPISAGEGQNRLKAFNDEVKNFRAAFQQELLDENNDVIQESRGKFALSRPGKFRWEYSRPYEQLIVGDGQRIWVYDVDLEQVTVKSVNDALGSAPAFVLTGGRPLENDFTVREAGENEGLVWVELIPKEQNSDFQTVMLGFAESGLQHFEMIDQFGQRTRIRFFDVERNQPISRELFQFEPPPGVDVVGG